MDQHVQDMTEIKPPTHHRSRLQCGVAIVLLIPLGLATRQFDWLPEFIRDHAGDALWAALVYWGIAFVLPRLSIRALALGALTFSFAIELSQLSTHPLLVEARAHRLGALVLGHGFLWIDLIRYAVGIAIAAGVDHFLTASRNSEAPRPDPSGD